jgi:hypothetical protein
MSKLSDKIDLKAIERKTYTSYHEDGIVDLFIGLIVLTSTLYIYAEMFWLVGSFVAIYTPMYMSIKQKVTFPRLGQVTFSKKRTGKSRRSYTFLIAINVVALFFGIFFWWSFSGGVPPSWFPVFVEYFPIIIGALGAGIMAVIAKIMEIARFNNYAVATLVVIGSAQFIPIPFIVHIAVLGLIICASGYLQLERFKRKYPLVGEN